MQVHRLSPNRGAVYSAILTPCNVTDETGEKKLTEIFKKTLTVTYNSYSSNTGDGKSHTLNHCFFNGDEVFRTSPAQESCTIGVWAAYDPELQIVCLDTEGLMGSAKLADAHHRARLLVKVIYRWKMYKRESKMNQCR
ncbi:unnamed protein product [Nesidiocoris tenuis]|uniref:Uncharacterized protein n=1 Tax=Nesidiocoris tenuis TaxID=355587 RepID=A0A6H5G8E8_9HEMI|nr:unnamed protein product [Nesidiocoris tenuis]CAA9998465.1 unnamed protein product [Nesidiocoris tenuis]